MLPPLDMLVLVIMVGGQAALWHPYLPLPRAGHPAQPLPPHCSWLAASHFHPSRRASSFSAPGWAAQLFANQSSPARLPSWPPGQVLLHSRRKPLQALGAFLQQENGLVAQTSAWVHPQRREVGRKDYVSSQGHAATRSNYWAWGLSCLCP